MVAAYVHQAQRQARLASFHNVSDLRRPQRIVQAASHAFALCKLVQANQCALKGLLFRHFSGPVEGDRTRGTARESRESPKLSIKGYAPLLINRQHARRRVGLPSFTNESLFGYCEFIDSEVCVLQSSVSRQKPLAKKRAC